MKQDKKHTIKETPLVDSIQNLDGFNVPENYFDSLHDSIMNKTKDIELNKTKTIFFTPKKIMAYAATIIILIGVSIYLTPKEIIIDNELAFEDVYATEYFEAFTETEFDLENNIEFDEISIDF